MKNAPSSLVIGAGPAGLSAALGLAAEGYAVEIIERHSRPPPRVCGSFLSAEALRHLGSLGVLSGAQALGSPVTEVRFFSRLEHHLRLPSPGLALPRERLESLLREAFLRRGGSIHWGLGARPGRHSEEVITQGPAAPEGRAMAADLVIWADGRFSSRRSAAGSWYGWNAEFANVRQRPGELSFFVYPGGYAGALTFEGGATNICGLHRRPQAAGWENIYQEARRRSPALADLMAGSRRVTPWRGVGPMPFTKGIEKGARRGAVGDAAGVGDPFFGEGIGRALAAGPILRQALAAGAGLEKVGVIQHRTYRRRFWLGRLGRAAVGGFAAPLLARWPGIAAPFLSAAYADREPARSGGR